MCLIMLCYFRDFLWPTIFGHCKKTKFAKLQKNKKKFGENVLRIDLLKKMLLCPRPVPGLLGWAYPEQLGLSSTACGLVLGDSIRSCTNVVSLLHQIASVEPLSKPQTMY